jgi:hypothetical protein
MNAPDHMFYWSPVAELKPFKKHFDEFAPKGTAKTFVAALKWVCREGNEGEGRGENMYFGNNI